MLYSFDTLGHFPISETQTIEYLLSVKSVFCPATFVREGQRGYLRFVLFSLLSVLICLLCVLIPKK